MSTTDTTTQTFQAGDLVVVVPGGDHPTLHGAGTYDDIDQERRVWVHTGTSSTTSSGRQVLLVGYRQEGSTELTAGWEIGNNRGQLEPHLADGFGPFGGWFVEPGDVRLANLSEILAADPVLLHQATLLARQEARLAAEPAEQAGEEALAAYKLLVARAVTKEATRRGWCDEVDGWLEEIGLARTTTTWKVKVVPAAFELEVEIRDGLEDNVDKVRDLVYEKLGLRPDRVHEVVNLTIGDATVEIRDLGCNWAIEVVRP